MNEEFQLSSYDFDLPESLIAQNPPLIRGTSRLMVLPGNGKGRPEHFAFEDLPSLLPENSLLVANNVRVLPARLRGKKDTGGKTELLLLSPLPSLNITEDGQDFFKAEVKTLARPARDFKPGITFSFSADLSFTPTLQGEYGQTLGWLRWRGDLRASLLAVGEIPLPPYIHRPQTEEDSRRYQTVYASEDKYGAVAAPTAGLHFTPELQSALRAAGMSWAELTLYVGYGTFSPIRTEDIREHKMHEEFLEIPASTVNAVLRAKQEGRPVVAVGTTSARALEGTAGQLKADTDFSGSTDIFIYPGYKFKVLDHLITNFHLPRSSLLVLACALAGREKLLKAYEEAVLRGYRFFSYGDAMLI